MDRYVKRLKDADIETRVSNVRALINDMSADLRRQANTHVAGFLPRTELVLDYTLTRLSLADARLLTEQMVAGVVTHLDQLRANVEGFVNGQAAAHVTQAETYAEGLLSVLATWPQQREAEAITQAAAKYRRSLGARLSGVNKQVTQAKAALEEVKSAHEETAGKFESSVNSFQSTVDERLSQLDERLEGMDERLGELRTTIDNQKARLDDAIARYESQFSEAQAGRTETFTTAMSEVAERADDIAGRLKAKADVILAELEEHRKETEELVGVIAASGTSHAYGKEAEDQRKSADFWRWTTVIVGLGAAAFVVWTVARITAEEVSLGITIARAIASVVLFGIAGYAANQSSLHRRREEDARRRELELVALGPFIASLPEEKQQAQREALVAKMFGQASDGLVNGRPALTDDTVTLIGRLIEIVTRANK